MKHAIFAVVAVGLVVWRAAQPEVAIYAFALLAGAGLRSIADSVETWRRR